MGVLANVEVAAKGGAILRAWSLVPLVGNNDAVVVLAPYVCSTPISESMSETLHTQSTSGAWLVCRA